MKSRLRAKVVFVGASNVKGCIPAISPTLSDSSKRSTQVANRASDTITVKASW